MKKYWPILVFLALLGAAIYVCSNLTIKVTTSDGQVFTGPQVLEAFKHQEDLDNACPSGIIFTKNGKDPYCVPVGEGETYTLFRSVSFGTDKEGEWYYPDLETAVAFQFHDLGDRPVAVWCGDKTYESTLLEVMNDLNDSDGYFFGYEGSPTTICPQGDLYIFPPK